MESNIRHRKKKIQYKTKNLNDITNLQTFVKENYNYIPKGKFKKSYTSQGMVLGMSIGIAIGAALGKIALGLPVGMLWGLGIGGFIGSKADRKAEIENRVL
jgi:hypothetical protein